MRCEHDHESEHCPLCTDDPEEAARRTATATGFAGSVLGAVGGPVGAGVSGLVWGTAGYVAGYTAASARERMGSAHDDGSAGGDAMTIPTEHESNPDEDVGDGDEQQRSDGDDA
jgi:hypothetical protein